MSYVSFHRSYIQDSSKSAGLWAVVTRHTPPDESGATATCKGHQPTLPRPQTVLTSLLPPRDLFRLALNLVRHRHFVSVCIKLPGRFRWFKVRLLQLIRRFLASVVNTL